MTRIEVIAVGDELLSGDTVDTNFGAIAQGLLDVGCEVSRHVTIADDRRVIAAQVSESLARAGVVIVTGGLGPTNDDLTRFGVADAIGVSLVLDPLALERIRERFRQFGIANMPDSNQVQAMFPLGAVILENPGGTAAGFLCDVPQSMALATAAGKALPPQIGDEYPGSETGAAAPTGDPRARFQKHVFVLPGPPRELGPMIERHVVPFLKSRVLGRVVQAKRLRTLGIGESLLAEKISGWPFGIEGVSLGYYPQDPGVDLKITARGENVRRVEENLESATARLRQILGEDIYGEGRATLAEIVGDLLRRRGATLAIAESCTGGLLGSIVTSASGASDYLDSCVVSYSNDAKQALLGVSRALLESYGAVSENVARAMAEGVRAARGVSYGLAVTGIAGPKGGTPDKPVGLVYIAVSGPEGTEAWRTQQAGDRAAIQRRAAVAALDKLRRRLERRK